MHNPPWCQQKGLNNFKAALEEQTSHLLKELIHETIPVHADGDFIIIITVLCLQQHRERGINECLLQSSQLHFRSSSEASSLSPVLMCSKELGQTLARVWNTPGTATPSPQDSERAENRHIQQ